MMASPRRALAPLDANRPSPSSAKLKSPAKVLSPCAELLKRPVPMSPVRERKRALEEEERVVKRSCPGVESPRSVTGNVSRESVSPDASSVFDADSTQTTESSLEGDRQRAHARKMAGDLLARLRLAKYKVRTGQVHVPFPQLEAQVPRVQIRSSSPEREPEDAETDESGDVEREEGRIPEGREKPSVVAVTPRRRLQGEVQTNSVLRGGAASGLLRLSQGSP